MTPVTSYRPLTLAQLRELFQRDRNSRSSSAAAEELARRWLAGEIIVCEKVKP